MLKYLKTKECPFCGCTEIIREEVQKAVFTSTPQIKEHSNKQRWEKRKFLCGYEVEYIPNYEKDIPHIYSECFYSEGAIAARERRERIHKINNEFSY